MNGKKRITGRPIVCGTDFSATAVQAVDIAAAMARRLGTELVLVHVDEFYGLAPEEPRLFEAALSEKRHALNDEANRLRNLGTQVKEKLLSGSAVDRLVDHSRARAGVLALRGGRAHDRSYAGAQPESASRV
jgi:nucleotide-binding universal stress UspA family protein